MSRRRPSCCYVEALEDRRMLAFGVTTSTAPTGQAVYVIDNGGNLKFSVVTGGNVTSTLHVADVSSIKYKNQELLAPFSTTGRYSHYEQGLGSTTSITYTIDNAAGWILVACDNSDATSGGVIQYYAVRKNDDNLYMASLPTDVHNGPGEGRFIAYLDRNVFMNPEAPSDNAGSTGAIEGSDVYGHADGTTTSKFYNMGRRMIENVYHGVTGNSAGVNVGAWMFMGNREHSAGGPFFKDIDFQSGSAVEMYNCLFTGHTQTESFRQGLQGPYAMQFTDGTVPSTTPDYSWLETLKDAQGNLLIHGLIPAEQRGTLTGTATGVPVGHEVTVGLSNTTAQYWTNPDATGNYTINSIQPGTYTETLYDGELEVGTKTVTITPGVTTPANIGNSFYIPSSPIFRIGTWDGTPAGFLNADKIEIMHPSDVRMSPWTSTPNFVVGTNTDAQWPMDEFMGVNNSQRITFNLTSAQVQNLTLRIGITLGFEGARPRVTVNSGKTYAWTSAIPTASVDLNSRGVTRGTWRGDNQLYTFSIPSSAVRAGTNTIDLPMVSGSYASGQTWLSPNAVFDAIDLVPTSSASPGAIANVTLSPANSSVVAGTGKSFTAVAKDSSGKAINADVDWSASFGAIDSNGNYVAPMTTGTATIAATATRTRTPGYSVSSSSSTAVGSLLTGSGSTPLTIVAPTTFFGTASTDSFYLRRNGTNLDIWTNGDGTGAPAYSVSYAGLSSLSFSGNGGDDRLTIDASAGNPIPSGGVSFDGGAGSDTLAVIGTAGDDTFTFNASSVALNGSTVSHTAVERRLLTGNGGGDNLTINAGTVTLSSALKTKLLTIAAGATLDVADKPMVLSNTSVSAVQPLVASGFNHGDWLGAGITSSTAAADPTGRTAVGFASNAMLSRTAFGGFEGLSGGEVLVKYTYAGDADLDGTMTLDDFSLFLGGYENAGNTWFTGDFDYDGRVTLDDFSLFLSAYQNQSARIA